MEQNVVKRLWSPVMVLPLAICTPFAYLWANNWYAFSDIDLVFCAAVVACAATVTGVFVFIAKRIFNKLLRSSSAWRLGYALLATLTVLLIAFFGYNTFQALSADRKILAVILILAITIANLIVLFTKFKLLNTFLLVSILLSFGNGLVNWAYDEINQNPAAPLNLNVNLKNKPNIYLYILESFNDLGLMNTVYGVETDAFKSFLDSREFVTYKNVYSNSTNTLLSLMDLFSMRLYSAEEKGNQDVAKIARDTIGGGEGNTAFRILHENGYNVIFVTKGDPYYFHRKGSFIDQTDLDSHFPNWKNFRPIASANPLLLKAMNKWKRLIKLETAVDWGLDKARGNAPYLLYFKGGSLHSSGEPYSWKQADEWVASGRYKKWTEISLKDSMPLLDQIIEQDPDSIIILMGDHGAARYRYIWSSDGSAAKTNENFVNSGISGEEIAKDLSNIFLAVRIGSTGQDISNDEVMSPVNLFLHIFAYLSNQESLLEQRAASTTSLGSLLLVRDGKALEEWEQVPNSLR
jgi:hypothetical protein